MYVDEVDVLLNDSNKNKNKEQFNNKQHKVNNITIYAEHEFQNMLRMMSLNGCNLIHMRACNIYNKALKYRGRFGLSIKINAKSFYIYEFINFHLICVYTQATAGCYVTVDHSFY